VKGGNIGLEGGGIGLEGGGIAALWGRQPLGGPPRHLVSVVPSKNPRPAMILRTVVGKIGRQLAIYGGSWQDKVVVGRIEWQLAG